MNSCPIAAVSRRILELFGQMDDDLHLDGDGGRKRIDGEGRPSGSNFPEGLGPHLVVATKVSLHVDEEGGNVHDLIHASAGFLDDAANVLDNGPGLGSNVIIQRFPVLIVNGAAGDGVGPG